MTTPTTMTTSMIITATAMMTDVVVAPLLGALLVDGVLLLTGMVDCMVWEGVGVDAVETKHTSCHFTYIATKGMKR